MSATLEQLLDAVTVADYGRYSPLDGATESSLLGLIAAVIVRQPVSGGGARILLGWNFDDGSTGLEDLPVIYFAADEAYFILDGSLSTAGELSGQSHVYHPDEQHVEVESDTCLTGYQVALRKVTRALKEKREETTT